MDDNQDPDKDDDNQDPDNDDDNQDPDYVPSEESGDEVEGGDQARKVYCGRQTKRRGATKKHLQGVSVKKTVNMTLEIKAWTIRTLDNVNIAKAIMLTVIMSVYM